MLWDDSDDFFRCACLLGILTALVTAILGLGVWLIKRQIIKNDSIREAKEIEKQKKSLSVNSTEKALVDCISIYKSCYSTQ
jgi:hypothetical protein